MHIEISGVLVDYISWNTIDHGLSDVHRYVVDLSLVVFVIDQIARY